MSAAGERLRLAELLRVHRGRLIAEAGGLAELPRVLDRLVARLEAPSGGPAALELPEQPSNLEALITGHRALRRSLHRVLAGELARVDPAELDVLHDELDEELIRAASAQAEAERQRAVDALEDSMPFLAVDKGWRITLVNHAQEKISGRRREDTVGQVLWDAFPGTKDPGKQYQAEYHRAMRERVPVYFEEHYQTEDLDAWTAVSAFPATDGGLNIFYVDVTAQKRAEEAARRREEVYRRIFESPFLGLLFTDYEGRVLDANDAFLQLVGYGREELAGGQLHWDALTPTAWREADARALEQLRSAGIASAYEKEYQRRDGRRVPVLVGSTRVESQRQNLTFALDISERKQAENVQRLFIEVGRLLSESLDVDTLVRTIVRRAVGPLADFCTLDLLDEAGQLRRMEVYGADPALDEIVQRSRPYPPRVGSKSPMARVLATGEPLLARMTPEWLDSAAQSPEHRALLAKLAPTAAAIVPLRARGRMLGLLNLGWTRAHPLPTPRDLELAASVADRAAVALDNALLYREVTLEHERLARSEARLQVKAEVSRMLAESRPGLRAVLQAACERLSETLGDLSFVRLLSEDGKRLELVTAHSRAPEGEALARGFAEDHAWRPEEGPAAQVLRTGRALRLEALSPEQLESFKAGFQRELGPLIDRLAPHSLLVIPLRSRERALGALSMIRTTTAAPYTAEDEAFAQELADRVALGVENARLLAREQHSRERAEESLALVDALLSASPVGVTFYDRALRLVRANAMIAALAGVPMETLAGRAVGEALPAMAPTLEPALRRVLETGEPVVDLEVTVPMPAAGGAPRALKVNFYPVRTGDGQLQGVGAVLADVTESKRVEEELRRAAEFRERFLGIVSHDLRNPINAIKMSATLLQRADDLPDRLGKPVARIHASADRISRMISELLDFTRGRLGGGIPIAPQPGDLLALVRQVLEEMELTHPGRVLALRAHGHFEGEWDPDRLAQVVSNLAGNALRYSPADTPVTVTLSEQGAEVELAVHNAGAPISPNILPHVFNPFRRGTAQAERSPEGLGLGLFIVQEIVHAHGGTIAVRSTKEAGTTFTVRLPRRR